ncbi:hypothetical protein CBER1_03225 [Cercospora berteroae]|uniref:Nephrocystin 3-like N-terminal domain-containing protein n=1 Tax=Cercospora berteroae TaxID=357750 RepID=A0A2S6CL89_9PEZI|nr:hypothetical protein CBER1_03225 [Cercospora berteroae]
MTTERVAENADNGFVNNGVVKDISAFLHNNKIRSMGGMTFNNTYHGHTHADGYGPCIAALGQTNPRNHREALMRTNAPTEGTCQWILEDEKFQKWNGVTRPRDPLLWISAGTGKVHGSPSAPNVEENSTLGPPDFRMIVLSQSGPAFVVKHFKDFLSITLDHQPGKNTQSDLKLFIDE